MTEIFKELLKTPLTYSYHSGPEAVGNLKEAQNLGINCIALTHLIIRRLFGTSVPPDLDCVAMFLDNPYFKVVRADEPLKTGDVAFFGKPGITEFRTIPPEVRHSRAEVRSFKKRYPGLHLALCTGEVDLTGQPLLIHANHPDGGVSVWPLDKFQTYRNRQGASPYGVLYGIRRVAK